MPKQKVCQNAPSIGQNTPQKRIKYPNKEPQNPKKGVKTPLFLHVKLAAAVVFLAVPLTRAHSVRRAFILISAGAFAVTAVQTFDDTIHNFLVGIELPTGENMLLHKCKIVRHNYNYLNVNKLPYSTGVLRKTTRSCHKLSPNSAGIFR